MNVGRDSRADAVRPSLLALEIPGARTVSVALVIGVGFSDDPDEAGGVSHLAEHVALATAMRGAPANFPAILAQTHATHTAFVSDALPEELPDVLRRLLLILSPHMYPEKRVMSREGGIMSLELAISPAGRHETVLADVARRIAPGLLLEREHDGAIGEVSNLGLEFVGAHLAKWYVADNATLIVTGAFQPQDLVSLSGEVAGMRHLAGRQGAHAWTVPEGTHTVVSSSGRIYWGVAALLDCASLRPAWDWCVQESLGESLAVLRPLLAERHAEFVGSSVGRSSKGGLAVHAVVGGMSEPSRMADDLFATLTESQVRSRVVSRLSASASHLWKRQRALQCSTNGLRDAAIASVVGTGPSLDSWNEEANPTAFVECAEKFIERLLPWAMQSSLT